MRPIDADTLIIELEKDEALFDNEAMVARENSIKYTDNYAKIMWSRANGIRDAIVEVYDAPTIDIDKSKGEWIMHIDDLFPCESTQECSICHAEQLINGNDDNFCPNCGADMREREGK